MSGMDHGLVKRMRAEVGDRLAEQRRLDAASGVPPMSGEDERQFARALIAGVLEEHARTEITAGRVPAGAQEEEELAAAVHAALFGVGRLQPLLDDPQIENIDINGCDRVFLSRADGREVMADPVADSDEELVELIQALARVCSLVGYLEVDPGGLTRAHKLSLFYEQEAGGIEGFVHSRASEDRELWPALKLFFAKDDVEAAVR